MIMRPLCLQPLKVVDPDHPLAALVRKAQADSPAPAPPTADGAAQPSQVEYAADCEYLAVWPPARGPPQSSPCRVRDGWLREPRVFTQPSPARGLFLLPGT